MENGIRLEDRIIIFLQEKKSASLKQIYSEFTTTKKEVIRATIYHNIKNNGKIKKIDIGIYGLANNGSGVKCSDKK